MQLFSRFGLALIVSGFFVSSASAQVPPDISRWSGGTALSQAQGFNMGDPLHLTWGIAAQGVAINNDGGFADGNNNIRAFLNGIYGNQATWQPIFQQFFDRWDDLSGLEHTFEANDDGAAWATRFGPGSPGVVGTRADIRIGAKPLDGNSGVLAYNWLPSNGGEMVIDSSDNFFNNTTNNSIGLRNVLAHEHGHGLGMEHTTPSNNSFLMAPFLNTSFDGPQHHDILIAHRGYGDKNEKTNAQQGNDTASLATSLGLIADGATAAIGQDAQRGSIEVLGNETDFVSIDDQTDTDFYSFSIGQASVVDINLDALGYTYIMGSQTGATGNFSSQTRSDLSLSLFGTDGTTLLGMIDANGLGGSETLLGMMLNSAGTYFVRVACSLMLGPNR